MSGADQAGLMVAGLYCVVTIVGLWWSLGGKWRA